jgi:hypothetical protein
MPCAGILRWWNHPDSKRVCENLKENRQPVDFAKAYLSGLSRQAHAIYGTVENGLSMVFITLGEPQAHGDTAKAVPFVQRRFFIRFFVVAPRQQLLQNGAVGKKRRQAGMPCPSFDSLLPKASCDVQVGELKKSKQALRD